MISIVDAVVLARTKLRVHKVRTGFAVGIAGILFGLIAAAIIIMQGIFSSIASFSDEGLNNRTIVSVTRAGDMYGTDAYEMREDAGLIAAVESAHRALVAKKQTAAQKNGIDYQARSEDPSPVEVDRATGKKRISDEGLGSPVVESVAASYGDNRYIPFNIKEHIATYSSARVLQSNMPVLSQDGSLQYMKDGKEPKEFAIDRSSSFMSDDAMTLMVYGETVTKPFVTNMAYNPTSGELPIILPYGAAEKLLQLKPLDDTASQQQHLNRLRDVRRRVGEITVSFCHRNTASQQLLARATSQQKSSATVEQPLLYDVPDPASCGAVVTAKDTRTAEERRVDAAFVQYAKDIGTYVGEPDQQKIVFRGVGISGDALYEQSSSVIGLVSGLLNSSLGYNVWSIPEDLLKKVPAQYVPEAVFADNSLPKSRAGVVMYESYLVEFTDVDQARAFMKQNGGMSGVQSNEVFATPFGSNMLITEEMKDYFEQALKWVFLTLGLVAVFILMGIIGRTMAESRRESAIFRAIGARRQDIGKIYGVYAGLLSVRVIMFALALGALLAGILDALYTEKATIGAHLAYAASDVSKSFHFFGLISPYLLWLIGVILVAGLVASIIPILLGARRNPIHDMRDDT